MFRRLLVIFRSSIIIKIIYTIAFNVLYCIFLHFMMLEDLKITKSCVYSTYSFTVLYNTTERLHKIYISKSHQQNEGWSNNTKLAMKTCEKKWQNSNTWEWHKQIKNACSKKLKADPVLPLLPGYFVFIFALNVEQYNFVFRALYLAFHIKGTT